MTNFFALFIDFYHCNVVVSFLLGIQRSGSERTVKQLAVISSKNLTDIEFSICPDASTWLRVKSNLA